MSEETLNVVVSGTKQVAEDVLEITLRRADHAELPSWTPGAHIDVHLDNGLVRQYSLCGDPAERNTWTIASLRDPQSRGGSNRLHQLEYGDALEVRGPRNHFPLANNDSFVFIAGGIGITPLLPMIKCVQTRGLPWKLHYAGRSADSMAFAQDLTEQFGDRVELYFSEHGKRMDLSQLASAIPEGASVYCCGPERLLVAVEEEISPQLGGQLYVERFRPRELDTSDSSDISVELAESGFTVEVPADRSILEVVREAGVDIESSCEEGTCGTCETEVLDGEPDHRDSVLSDFERELNETMMICVSRACGRHLVLDL